MYVGRHAGTLVLSLCFLSFPVEKINYSTIVFHCYISFRQNLKIVWDAVSGAVT